MIVYKDSDDISVFLDLDYLLDWIEAIDVEEDPAEVYTDEGVKITLSVLPSGRIAASYSEPAPDNRKRYEKLITKFVKKILESGARSRVLKEKGICEEIAAIFAIDKK